MRWRRKASAALQSTSPLTSQIHLPRSLIWRGLDLRYFIITYSKLESVWPTVCAKKSWNKNEITYVFFVVNKLISLNLNCPAYFQNRCEWQLDLEKNQQSQEFVVKDIVKKNIWYFNSLLNIDRPCFINFCTNITYGYNLGRESYIRM